MITRDKVTEIFCIIDEFDKNLNEELKKNLRLPSKDICSALTAYCFFDNKPDALPVHVEKSRQLELFKL